MKNIPRTHGFTLVEMSIVIVIIGLIIGGLMGTTSMLRNAKLTTMMNEGKYYINAFIQFQTRYGAPPGDFCRTATVCSTQAAATTNLVWPTAPDNASNGDGNGLIRTNTTCAAGTTADCFKNEQYYAFRHLALAGFIQGKYSGTGDTGGTGGTIGLNVPGTAVDQSAFVFDHPNAMDGVVSGDAIYFDGMYGNTLRIAGLIAGATTEPDRPFLAPKQALQIDEKFDDSKPGQGSILTPKDSVTFDNCVTTAVDTTAEYETSLENQSCLLIVKMQ